MTQDSKIDQESLAETWRRVNMHATEAQKIELKRRHDELYAVINAAISFFSLESKIKFDLKNLKEKISSFRKALFPLCGAFIANHLSETYLGLGLPLSVSILLFGMPAALILVGIFFEGIEERSLSSRLDRLHELQFFVASQWTALGISSIATKIELTDLKNFVDEADGFIIRNDAYYSWCERAERAIIKGILPDS